MEETKQLTDNYPKDKVEFGGSCNRSACLAPHALWYNHSTRMYYCTACAKLLNQVNEADAMRLFGHDLCTYGLYSDRPPVL